MPILDRSAALHPAETFAAPPETRPPRRQNPFSADKRLPSSSGTVCPAAAAAPLLETQESRCWHVRSVTAPVPDCCARPDFPGAISPLGGTPSPLHPRFQNAVATTPKGF